MKLSGLINRIEILSTNILPKEYITKTITEILTLTETPDLIDDVITSVTEKNLSGNLFKKVFIVDDSCEKVIPEEKCININPYIVYVHYSLFIAMLREYGVNEMVLKQYNELLIQATSSDFDLSDSTSYPNQYRHINNFSVMLQPNLETNILVKKLDYNDNELLRILDIIRTIYSDDIRFEKDELMTCTDFMTKNTFGNIESEEDNMVILRKYYDMIKSSYLGRERDENNKFNVGILRFWQEYYYLFYLSLKIIKNYYTSNSKIIALGESSSKLVFTQSIFYEDQESYTMIKNVQGTQPYPRNLTFSYFPLSGIGRDFFKNNAPRFIQNIFDVSLENALDILYSNFNSEPNIINNYLTYFMAHMVDPLYIVNCEEENVIFVDRCEGFTSISTFIYMYYEFIKKQKLNRDQITIFLNKFKIVGFDGNYDDSEIANRKIETTRKIIMSLFGVSYDKSCDIFKANMINLYAQSLPRINLSRRDRTGSFLYSHSIVNTLINFASLPEKLHFNSRCVESKKYIDIISTNISGLTNIKEKTNSENCNLINYVIYLRNV